MNASELAGRVRGGLFIAAMMGSADGAFCAERGREAALVQIGALVADAVDRSHDAKYLLPLDEDDMAPILRAHVDAVRATLGETPVCLNAAVGDLESCLCMARAFRRAGGDLFELNCHGGYGKLLDRGLLRAMVLPEHRPKMIEYLRALCELDIPIIVKFHGRTEVDFAEVLQELDGVGALWGVHFNVRGENDDPDCALVRDVRGGVKGVLLCSGCVTTREHVDSLLEAGADCVGIARGVLDDPGIIARLAAADRDR